MKAKGALSLLTLLFSPLLPLSNAFHTTTPYASCKYETFSRRLARNENNSDDPTNNLFASLADSVQNLVTNYSPLNQAKIALVTSLAGDYDVEATRSKLASLVDDSKDRVLVLSFTTWPFCVKAIDLLEQRGCSTSNGSLKVLQLNEVEDGNALRAEMAKLIGRTSVPAIWIDGEFIGGCNDGGSRGGLNKMDEKGDLKNKLREMGVV